MALSVFNFNFNTTGHFASTSEAATPGASTPTLFDNDFHYDDGAYMEDYPKSLEDLFFNFDNDYNDTDKVHGDWENTATNTPSENAESTVCLDEDQVGEPPQTHSPAAKPEPWHKREQPMRSCRTVANPNAAIVGSSSKGKKVRAPAPTKRSLPSRPKTSLVRRQKIDAHATRKGPYVSSRSSNTGRPAPPLKVFTVTCHYDDCGDVLTGTHEDFKHHLQKKHKTARHKSCKWTVSVSGEGVAQPCGEACAYSNTLSRHVIDKHVQVYNTTCSDCKKTFRFDKFTNNRHKCVV